MAGSSLYKTVLKETGTNDLFIGPSNEVVLMGFSVGENGGASGPYEAEIFDGTTGSGTKIFHLEGTGDTTDWAWFGPEGIAAINGISLKVVSGTLDMTIFFRD